jgi:hypothetical protein
MPKNLKVKTRLKKFRSKSFLTSHSRFSKFGHTVNSTPSALFLKKYFSLHSHSLRWLPAPDSRHSEPSDSCRSTHQDVHDLCLWIASRACAGRSSRCCCGCFDEDSGQPSRIATRRSSSKSPNRTPSNNVANQVFDVPCPPPASAPWRGRPFEHILADWPQPGGSALVVASGAPERDGKGLVYFDFHPPIHNVEKGGRSAESSRRLHCRSRRLPRQGAVARDFAVVVAAGQRLCAFVGRFVQAAAVATTHFGCVRTRSACPWYGHVFRVPADPVRCQADAARGRDVPLGYQRGDSDDAKALGPRRQYDAGPGRGNVRSSGTYCSTSKELAACLTEAARKVILNRCFFLVVFLRSCSVGQACSSTASVGKYGSYHERRCEGARASRCRHA